MGFKTLSLGVSHSERVLKPISEWKKYFNEHDDDNDDDDDDNNKSNDLNNSNRKVLSGAWFVNTEPPETLQI